MAESVNDASNGEDKIEAPASSNSSLQVSVSFGRFENDSLSWEKFSSFSPNKYLEEVEKCATAGSVAQKKAYFEAHYKKIAERKAELMDQVKQMEKKASSRSSDQTSENSSTDNCEANSDTTVTNAQCSYEEDKHVTHMARGVNETHVDEPKEETVIIKEYQGSLSVEELKEEVGGSLDSPKLEKPEEFVLVKEGEEEKVKEEIPSKGSEDANEIPSKDKEKQKDSTRKIREGSSMKVDRRKGSPKINQVNNKTVTNKSTPVSKERPVTVTKKKPVSPASKAPGFSTPRVSKLPSTFTSMSRSQSSVKKENVSTTLPRSKNTSVVAGTNKQMASKSLHMSLSLGLSGSDPSSLTLTRKSLIMERMGDKDIVKRAFKTFQNSYNQLKSSTDGQTAVPKQVPAKVTKVSTLLTPRKEDGGGSLRAGGVEKKSAKTTLSSFGLNSKEKAEKRKELSKNLGYKSYARVVERTCMQTKLPKEGETNVKNRRHSLDMKAKPLPGSNQEQKLSKGSIFK